MRPRSAGRNPSVQSRLFQVGGDFGMPIGNRNSQAAVPISPAKDLKFGSVQLSMWGGGL